MCLEHIRTQPLYFNFLVKYLSILSYLLIQITRGGYIPILLARRNCIALVRVIKRQIKPKEENIKSNMLFKSLRVLEKEVKIDRYLSLLVNKVINRPKINYPSRNVFILTTNCQYFAPTTNCCVKDGEAANDNATVFSFTRQNIHFTNSCTRSELSSWEREGNMRALLSGSMANGRLPKTYE